MLHYLTNKVISQSYQIIHYLVYYYMLAFIVICDCSPGLLFKREIVFHNLLKKKVVPINYMCSALSHTPPSEQNKQHTKPYTLWYVQKKAQSLSLCHFNLIYSKRNSQLIAIISYTSNYFGSIFPFS